MLIALSTAALSLPAFSAPQPVETELAIRASAYEEGDLPGHKVLLGSTDRYEIDIYQFHLLTPVARNWSLSLDASREIMSGASPWGTVKAADGSPGLIMSGATIRESRTEISITANRHFEQYSLGIGLTHSEEDDYESKAITLTGEWNFNNNLSTLALGFSYSDDRIEPSDALLFSRVQKEDKNSGSITASWTQVLNRTSVLQYSIGATRHSGYLSDPYKLRDVRPDERLEWTAGLRYRKFFETINSAMHLDYRYYRDDFGIRSHTLQSAWYQNITSNLQIVPSIRYYSQAEADFYLPIDDFTLPLNVYQSSDFRLSGFGAYTFGLKGILNYHRWSVSLNFDRYISSGKYGLSESEPEHPALLDFNLASIGFDFRF